VVTGTSSGWQRDSQREGYRQSAEQHRRHKQMLRAAEQNARTTTPVIVRLDYDGAMSSTRLLVLGAVRFMQPVHGYDVRRELVSWQLDEVTNVKPGSIYSALKTLERDGLIKARGQERLAGRPERTTYELTAEGEKEFQLLLRQSWWEVTPAVEPLVPALTMFQSMSRPELITALGARIEQLRGRQRQLGFLEASIKPGATGADGEIPDHAREILLFLQSRMRAEIDWTRSFRRRLQDGKYLLADESGPPEGTAETGAEATTEPHRAT
jgi:DNA-binding PadR family transcriptional regulator